MGESRTPALRRGGVDARPAVDGIETLGSEDQVIAGRAEEPGRPILYGTTRRFLELFGLNSLKDLPQPENGLRPPANPLPVPAAEK